MIVFDLDGTLRDIRGCEHTVPDDKSRAEHWLNWQRWVNENGKPVRAIMELFVSFSMMGHQMRIVTNSQFGTHSWMTRNLPKFIRHNPIVAIEREHDDHRHPHQFKCDWIDQHHDQIELWVDDDPVILDYAESLGIPVIRVTAALYAN